MMSNLCASENVQRKNQFSSLRRHIYLITPNEGFSLEPVDIISIIRGFLPFMPKADFFVNLINDNILIFTFKRAQRIRANKITRVDAIITRIKLSQMFNSLANFDWII